MFVKLQMYIAFFISQVNLIIYSIINTKIKYQQLTKSKQLSEIIL